MGKLIDGHFYSVYDKYHRIFIGVKNVPFEKECLYRSFHFMLNGDDMYLVFDDLKKETKTAYFGIPSKYAKHLNINVGDILEITPVKGTMSMHIKKSDLPKEIYYAEPEE